MTIAAIKARHDAQKEDKRYCRSLLTCGEVDELFKSHGELLKTNIYAHRAISDLKVLDQEICVDGILSIIEHAIHGAK